MVHLYIPQAAPLDVSKVLPQAVIGTAQAVDPAGAVGIVMAVLVVNRNVFILVLPLAAAIV